MQKKHSPQHALYWYILAEDEWYARSHDRRREIEQECLTEAKALGAKYANIMVNPDPVLSASPHPNTHHVWKWTAETEPCGETLDYWKQRALAAEQRLGELGG